MMSVADGADAESPSVWRGEALAGSHGGARETKRTHDYGDGKPNRLDQCQSLAEALIDPRVEFAVWDAVVFRDSRVNGDKPVHSGAWGNVGQVIEEFGLVCKVKVT